MQPSSSSFLLTTLNFIIKTFVSIGLVAAISYMGWYNYPKIHDLIYPPVPCSTPISYSIVTNDSRFNLATSSLLTIVDRAGKAWSTAHGKDLFVYDPTGHGTLAINLIYDYRQNTTKQLQGINSQISADKTKYLDLKRTYDALVATFTTEKNALTTESASLTNAQNAYQQKVQYWNTHGGAPEADYKALETQRTALNTRVAALNKRTTALNTQIPRIKDLESQLNTLAKTVDEAHSDYLDVGSSLSEFREGEYVSDTDGKQRIDIFQFDSQKILERVIMHELGHALGLEHNDNPNAIMYKINSGKSLDLAQDDIDGLTAICSAVTK